LLLSKTVLLLFLEDDEAWIKPLNLSKKSFLVSPSVIPSFLVKDLY
jgi:hypothetical protein